jgi:hypothetical protein
MSFQNMLISTLCCMGADVPSRNPGELDNRYCETAIGRVEIYMEWSLEAVTSERVNGEAGQIVVKAPQLCLYGDLFYFD